LDQQKVVARFLAAQDRLVLQASDLSLETIATMVERGSIDLQPAYQRRERWEVERQSALIESFILNVPVPPIYLSEDDFGHYSVIDGKQRITAITNFLKKRMKLTGLESFGLLEGASFQELPDEIKNALSIRPYVRVVTLLKQSDPELQYEVFTRLNKGGESLNPQEIRNVAFRGRLNDLIYRLAENKFLRTQLKITNDRANAYRAMADAEYVLRFLALSEVWDDFSGSLSRSMDQFMLRYRNATSDQMTDFRKTFSRAISYCERIWGHRAFKRPVDGGWREQMIAGMYDAQMISTTLLSDRKLETLVNNRVSVIRATVKLLDTDAQFEESVRRATNTPSRIRYRVITLKDLLDRLAR
jgi:hypothetical protein